MEVETEAHKDREDTLNISFLNINKIAQRGIPHARATDLVGDILILAETNPRKNNPSNITKIPGFDHFQTATKEMALV